MPITTDIFITIITHAVVFVLGIAFDRYVLRRLSGEHPQPIEVQWSELVRVSVLLSMFLTFLASIIVSQFFAGEQPSYWLSLVGIFSFGSLVGERDFFTKILSGFVNKK